MITTLLATTLLLNNGYDLPLIGLGTYKIKDQEGITLIKQALQHGYRHIDTATGYNNHKEIGSALQEFDRSKIFITTKINPADLENNSVEHVVKTILHDLKTNYIDLLLIHSPNLPLIHTLQEMQKLQKKGFIRSIGVSNCTIHHLQDIGDAGITIQVNQVEYHPYLNQRELLDYCKRAKITLMGYRPLIKGAITNDATLTDLAQKYKKTPAQIALRWALQLGIPIIPRANNQDQLQQNISVFDFTISNDDMNQIYLLHQNLRTCSGSWAQFDY